MDSCWPSRLETEEDALAAKSVFSQPESQLTTDTGPGRSVHTHTLHYTGYCRSDTCAHTETTLRYKEAVLLESVYCEACISHKHTRTPTFTPVPNLR